MRYLLILVLAIGFAGKVDSSEESTLSLNFPLSELRPVIIEAERNGITNLSYCPDNLCIVFEYPVDANKGAVLDFIVMFLFYKSGFPEFYDIEYDLPNGKNISRKVREQALDLLGKYKKEMGCIERDHSDEKIVDCVLDRLRTKLNIKSFFSREDEGTKILEELK